MLKQLLLGVIVCACISGDASAAQNNGKIDFVRDVQPLLKQHCVGCHGPTQQMNGFRLDRRSSAMRGGTFLMILPGNSELSRLYGRLTGKVPGPQMPPTGPLSPEQIATFKVWIDQGAEWPDEVSGDVQPALPDARAVRLADALQNGDLPSFKKRLSEDPKAGNLRAFGGATPLMYAALHGDTESVSLLLEKGADPNVRNDSGATALMWATDDAEKTRLLLERGAEVNAKSENGRTPLLIAADRFGSAPVVKLLLEKGADPSVKSSSIFGDITPLTEAARAGDAEAMRMLIARGANPKSAGPLALHFAMRANCAQCADMLIPALDQKEISMASNFLAPPFGDGLATKVLLDRGADANTRDPEGRTTLMLAAASDYLPVETVKTLINKGADIQARSLAGQTALDLAQQRGDTAVVDLLVKAGAKTALAANKSALQPKPAASARAAIEKIIPLLQKGDATFSRKTGCVSCHNNSLTAMTVAAARSKGLPVDDEVARKQLKTIASYIADWRDRLLQGIGIPGDSDTISYILLGMAAENYQPDTATEAMAHFIKRQQAPDGRWRILAHRPPIESSDIQVTAASLRALQVYAPKAHHSEYQKSIQLAATWLINSQPRTTEERAFRLLGLGWADADRKMIQEAARQLVAEQRSDGGWAQIPSLASDAYATGQALVALQKSGALQTTEPVYQRGIQFLMKTQLEDGSWHVKSRAIPFQPYFESGFPHGHDQWISAAASNWAAMALVPAVQ
jgi:ankyrin repeat protein